MIYLIKKLYNLNMCKRKEEKIGHLMINCMLSIIIGYSEKRQLWMLDGEEKKKLQVIFLQYVGWVFNCLVCVLVPVLSIICIMSTSDAKQSRTLPQNGFNIDWKGSTAPRKACLQNQNLVVKKCCKLSLKIILLLLKNHKIRISV